MHNCFFINSNISFENKLHDYKTYLESISGNTGNSYITYALIKKIYGKLVKVPHIQCIYTYDFNKNADKDIDYINNNCSHVFLILQDQIRITESYSLKLPYDKIISFLKKIRKPIIIAGLGANSFNGFYSDFFKDLPKELVTFLKELSCLVENLGVRGYFTQETLNNLGITNVDVIGCPSFYEMGRDRIIKKKELVSLNKVFLTSDIIIKKLRFNYRCMQDWQEEKYISYILENKILQNFNFSECINLYNKKLKIFSSIYEWKKFISNFDFAIGGRLHGSIISINAGVPALCCNGDSRAREMCQYLKIPYETEIRKKTNIFDLYENIDIDSMNKSYPLLYDKYDEFLKRAMNINKFEHSDLPEFIQPQFELYKNFDNIKLIVSYLRKKFKI